MLPDHQTTALSKTTALIGWISLLLGVGIAFCVATPGLDLIHDAIYLVDFVPHLLFLGTILLGCSLALEGPSEL